MNLRLGLNPEGQRWLAELYVTNLADKNAIVWSDTGNFDLRETTNEPRVDRPARQLLFRQGDQFAIAKP